MKRIICAQTLMVIYAGYPPSVSPVPAAANPAWNVPVPSANGDYATNPFTIYEPGITLLNQADLSAMARPLGKDNLTGHASLQLYKPGRLLVQEGIVSVVTRVQVGDGELDLKPVVEKVLANIPADQVAAFEQRMTELHRTTLERMNGDPAQWTDAEKAAHARAESEVQAARRAANTDPAAPFTNAEKAAMAQRAAGIIYDATARAGAQELINTGIKNAEAKGEVKLLTQHERANARVGIINGGPASGKGTNVNKVSVQLARESGLPVAPHPNAPNDASRGVANDRVYLNTDQFKQLLLGADQIPMQHKSALTAPEARYLAERVMTSLETGPTMPNVVIDRMKPAADQLALGAHSDHPTRLVLVATDVVTAVERSYSRGMSGQTDAERRFESTREILSVHQDISAKLPEVIGKHIGKNITLEIYDNNVPRGSDPELIMRGNLKDGTFEVLDPAKAARFFDKANINTGATAPDQAYSRRSAPNLDFVRAIAAQSPGKPVTVTVQLPGTDGRPIGTLEFKDGKFTSSDPAAVLRAAEANPEIRTMLSAVRPEELSPALTESLRPIRTTVTEITTAPRAEPATPPAAEAKPEGTRPAAPDEVARTRPATPAEPPASGVKAPPSDGTIVQLKPPPMADAGGTITQVKPAAPAPTGDGTIVQLRPPVQANGTVAGLPPTTGNNGTPPTPPTPPAQPTASGGQDPTEARWNKLLDEMTESRRATQGNQFSPEAEARLRQEATEARKRLQAAYEKVGTSREGLPADFFLKEMGPDLNKVMEAYGFEATNIKLTESGQSLAAHNQCLNTVIQNAITNNPEAQVTDTMRNVLRARNMTELHTRAASDAMFPTGYNPVVESGTNAGRTGGGSSAPSAPVDPNGTVVRGAPAAPADPNGTVVRGAPAAPADPNGTVVRGAPAAPDGTVVRGQPGAPATGSNGTPSDTVDYSLDDRSRLPRRVRDGLRAAGAEGNRLIREGQLTVPGYTETPEVQAEFDRMQRELDAKLNDYRRLPVGSSSV